MLKIKRMTLASIESKEPASSTTELSLKYLLIHGDDAGETHFKDIEVSMDLADFAPPAPPLYVSHFATAAGIVGIGFPPGWFGNFHPAPKEQWMIIVAGNLEIVVSDGEKRQLGVGTIALLKEAGTKGHSTRVIGDEDVFIVVTQLD